MSAAGRPGQRSLATPASGGGGHHRRQFSDHLLDSSSTGKWQQQMDVASMLRSYQWSGELPADPLAEPARMRSSSSRMGGEEYASMGESSPGLLDLHSFDTELLPDLPVPGMYGWNSFYSSYPGRSVDDTEATFSCNKQMNKSSGINEGNFLRSFSADKEKSAAKIKVVVRKRPINKKEISKKDEDIITIEPHSNSITVHETKLKVDLTEYVEKHEFTYDAVLDQNVSNDEVYHETVASIVPSIFQRIKATCFAYGQTGSGKTYTMHPLPLRASQDIFSLMHQIYRNQGFQLFVSFFEIYGGKLFDLLNDRRKLCMREDGKQQVCIVGLQEYRVFDVEAIREFIEKGNATRSTGTTGANEESSRSHAILQLVIKKSIDGNESKPARIVGKLSFIDLAGSERGADTTDNDKQTRMEGAEINKSLLALKECIRALDNDQGHIPFRGSKLTEVLRDSFVGNSRTVMISCISPNSGSCEHTLNTLRYADRVKSLSKGNNAKKDPLSSTFNLRDSTAAHVASPMATTSLNGELLSESDRIGWSKGNISDNSYPVNVGRLSGRDGVKSSSLYADLKEQKGRSYSKGEYHTTLEVSFEPDKPQRKRGKSDIQTLPFSENKLRNAEPDLDLNGFNSDDELNALLQEEEDLVVAHRKIVEETLDIIREEMKLLVEADKPSNQVDDYIARLSTILTQKAAGISNLQNRLANFQRRLTEQNVLLSFAGY